MQVTRESFSLRSAKDLAQRGDVLANRQIDSGARLGKTMVVLSRG